MPICFLTVSQYLLASAETYPEVFGPKGELGIGAVVLKVQQATADVALVVLHAVDDDAVVLLLADDIKGCRALWGPCDPGTTSKISGLPPFLHMFIAKSYPLQRYCQTMPPPV